MTRFIRRFKFAWRSAIAPDYLLDAELPGYWTVSDARTLLGFMRGETGKKLNQILKNYVVRSALDASNKIITRGQVRGIVSTVALIDHYFTGPALMEEEQSVTVSPNSREAREVAFAESYGV